jgi:hypothetical protein
MLVLRAVPKRLRARFNALESVKSFGWSGSAAAGGCACRDRLVAGICMCRQVFGVHRGFNQEMCSVAGCSSPRWVSSTPSSSQRS